MPQGRTSVCLSAIIVPGIPEQRISDRILEHGRIPDGATVSNDLKIQALTFEPELLPFERIPLMFSELLNFEAQTETIRFLYGGRKLGQRVPPLS